MVSFGHRQFLTFHLLLCAVTALAIGAFWRFSKGTPKGQLQQSFVWAEISINRISELGADERVLQAAANGGAPPPSSSAAPGGSSAHGAYSERLPLATAADPALRRLYSQQQEEAESALSSALPSRVQSASPSQHSLRAAAAGLPPATNSSYTAIPMSTPAVSVRVGNGTLHERPNKNPFK